MDNAKTYGPVAKTLHWLTVLLIAAQYAVGSLMPHIGRHTEDAGLVAWHILIGAAILLAVFLQLAWRLTHPVRLPEMPTWQTWLARLTHILLYGLVIAMVVLGWAATNYRGWTVSLFGIAPLPAIAGKGDAWAHQAGDIHSTLVYVLLGFILLHIAGALYHQLVKHDGVLGRMLPD